MRTKRRNALKRANNSEKKSQKPGNASVNRWNRREEIEFDDEDAFHENRDKILLEGEEDDGSDDDLKNEVFALKDYPDISESGEELHEVPEETDEVDSEPLKPAKAKKTAPVAPKKTAKDAVASSESSSDEDERFESWGRNKGAYYSTNAAGIASDDEEAQQLEEAEVLKLQTQARAALEEEDFGILDTPRELDLMDDTLAEPTTVTPVSQDPAVLLRHLEKTSPEALALAREWEDVVYDLARSQQVIDQTSAADAVKPAFGMLQLYHQTLLTYATTLAFYLHIRATPKYASNPKLLQSHPVLSRLLTLKQAMTSLERLDFGPNSDDEEGDEEEDEEEGDMFSFWKGDNLVDMDEEEYTELLREAQEINSSSPTKHKSPKAHDDKLTNGLSKSEEKEKKSKKEKKEKKEKHEKKERKKQQQPVFDLEEPEFVSVGKSKRHSTKPTQTDNLTPFGEYTSLDAVDSLDKKARKKSLQFHTSRIESASSRREQARGGAIGGDDDIPYRERDKEREARLKKETANQRGKAGDDLEDVEMDEVHVSKKRPREEGSDAEMDIDGYYDLVKRQKKTKKEERKAKYDAEKAAEKAAREGVEEETQDGQRGVTRTILKNKGLTPSRPKSVRNPRVKKRIKFDQAKKKVRSQKAVYKGGLATTGGHYDGEASGISTRVVKSVKLG